MNAKRSNCSEMQTTHLAHHRNVMGLRWYKSIYNMRNTNVIAKNPKHQKLVNRVVQWDVKHELANDERNLVYDTTECEYVEDDKLWKKWNKHVRMPA